MNGWKKTLPPILLAISGVLFVIMALEERLIDGGPIHYRWFGFAVMWFAIALAFFRSGQTSGGGAGPPNG